MRASSLLAIALTLFGVLAIAVAPARIEAQSPGVYIALGDSVAYGSGSSLPRTRSYPALLNQWIEQWADAPAPLTNLAIPGETTRSYIEGGQLARMRDEIRLARESGVPVLAVTLTLGGNDILALQDAAMADHGEALEQFQADFPSALAQVRDALGQDVPLIVTTYYDPTGGDPALPNTDSWWIARFNEVIAGAAVAEGALSVDLIPVFAGRADELTHYPTDVHPTNEGYLAIARAVWDALGFDAEAPTIDVLSSLEATRRTPTIRFQAADNVAIRTLSLEIANGVVSRPVPLGDGGFVALADLRDVEGERFEVVISASDEAGNRTEETVTLTIVE